MASIDPANQTDDIIENLLALSHDAVVETGVVGNTSNEPAVETAEPAVETTVELRTLSDGSVAAIPLKKRKAIESFEPVTPVKKVKKVKPPPAPVKPVSAPRVDVPVAIVRSPVVDMIVKGLEVYPDAIPELSALNSDLCGPYANYTLQRLLASYVGKIAAVGADDATADNALHQLLLVCYGYASVGQEQRVVLRETIKLPNFISKDTTAVLKHCKSLLGVSFPQEQQATVIAVMRGLWHLFERVHILPTVWHDSKWVYQRLDDCKNKATSL